jgi:aspartyl-tRNA(Asn)/glutamyl-tRNA(Gln) amidotransferase subunit A
VIFAQSTSPEFGHKGVTESPLRGVSRNPWNPGKTPGGSSGGAGAAVAAGLGPLAIGTDGGGSIRLPASFCGIVGHKATFGRVAAWPPSVNGDLANTGPMARTAEDCALMMNAIARPDVRDAGSLPPDDIDYTRKLETKLKKLKIGLVLRFGTHPLDPEVGALVSKAARAFEKLGCTVEEAKPDLGGVDARKTFGVHWLCFVQRVLQMFPPEKHQLLDPTLLAMARDGAKFTSADLVAAMADRRTLSIGWNRFFDTYDLLLCPTLAVPAFDTGKGAPDLPDGKPNMQWSPYTYHFNLSRHPSASVPCGLTKSGLPVGLMITAGHYRDALVLRAAHHYQQAAPVKVPALPA